MGLGNGWIELVLIEGRGLVAADVRGTSDPFVRVHYGNFKKKTKVGILHSCFLFHEIECQDLKCYIYYIIHIKGVERNQEDIGGNY